MADQDPTRRDPTLAQNDDAAAPAATPQDQFKPAESHFGQDGDSGATEIGGDRQQQGFSGDLGASESIAQPGQAALSGNDQAQPGGGGLGQNQQGYGQSPDLAPQAADQAEVTSHDTEKQGSAGIGTRSNNLGPSPTGGDSQPASGTTGGPDLSKGLGDNNRGGGI